MSALPLSGIRVLDLSKVLAGPLCAQYLGDMGADVIKVETPDQGDETRHWPPFREAGQDRTGAVFISANRNKRSLALDLNSEQGRSVVYRLAAVGGHRHRQFRPRGRAAARRRCPDAAFPQPAADMLRHLRLRQRRADARGQGLRRDPAILHRHAVHHRRAQRPTRAQPVFAGGPGDRPACPHRDTGGALPARAYRPGRHRRSLAVRYGHGIPWLFPPELLGAGHRTGEARIGPRVALSLPSL